MEHAMKTAIFRIIFALCVSGMLFAMGEKDVEAEKSVTLKLGFQANTSSKEYVAAERFAEEVKALSEGTVSVQIFAGGQLGDDRSMLEQVAAGALDLVYAETGRFGLWVEEAEIFGYPFAFNDFAHLERTLASDYGKSLHAKFLAKGWRILATGYNGTRQTTSNRPINSIADMKGMKLRVPNAAANLNFAKYAGAAPTPMAFAEVYLALKTNAVDGQENPLSTIDAQKFYEVQKFCALTGHILNDNNIVMSEAVYKKMSRQQQQAVMEAARRAQAYQTQLFTEDESRLIEVFKSKGMIVTAPDKTPFRSACKPMYDEYVAKYGVSAIDAINAAQ